MPNMAFLEGRRSESFAAINTMLTSLNQSPNSSSPHDHEEDDEKLRIKPLRQTQSCVFLNQESAKTEVSLRTELSASKISL